MNNQSQDLNLDSSQDIIIINKSILTFNLEPTTNPDVNGMYGKSESSIIVTNLVDSHVVIRTKTTKKDVYAVNPTYAFINPKETFEIKFVYHIKDLNDNPKKHKFKFEGVVYDPKQFLNAKPQDVFTYFIKSQEKVKGSAIKREVVFDFPKFDKMQENVSTSFIPHTSDSGNHNSQNPNSNQPVNKELEKQLQNLKIEYHNNKHKLKNLNETLKNLKSRADIEKKGPEGVSHSNFTVNQIVKEEKQIKKNTALILFVVSIIIGFILSS